MTGRRRTRVHEGVAEGRAHRAETWSTALTATTAERVFVRSVALDDVIGRESFPATLLRLWRGDTATEDEASGPRGMPGCLDRSRPALPSALVTRTIASTRATAMSGLAGGILAFGELHGAIVSRAMRILATAPADGDLDDWAEQVFSRSGPRGAAFRASATAGTTTTCARSASSRSPGRPRTDMASTPCARWLPASVDTRGRTCRSISMVRSRLPSPGCGWTRPTVTSCSRSRGASGWRPTSWRSRLASDRCGRSTRRPRTTTE